MYVDLDIIRTILNKHFKQKLQGVERIKLFNKIRDIRTHIKIHRDRSDFYITERTDWSTCKHGTDFQLQIKTKEGTMKNVIIEPQKDAKLVADILDRIFNG